MGEATVAGIGRTFLRRIASVGGVVFLALLMLSTWPIWVIGGGAFDLVRRKLRLPTVRLLGFALCWSWIEVGGILGAAWLSVTGRGADPARHFELQRSWAGALMTSLRWTVGLRITVENPEVLRPGPVLVLSRHASLADSLVSAYAVGNIARLNPRYVLKRELMADPCLDIVGHRLPNYFLDRGSDKQDDELRGIAQLGHGLGQYDVAVIFPEGTRMNPQKRERIMTAMRERNPQRATRLESLQHLLPPKPAGAVALLEAAPNADVVIAGHTGFDGLDTFGGILRRLEQGAGECRMWFVRIPRADVPAGAVVEWLDNCWMKLDAEVASRQVGAGTSAATGKDENEQ